MTPPTRERAGLKRSHDEPIRPSYSPTLNRLFLLVPWREPRRHAGKCSTDLKDTEGTQGGARVSTSCSRETDRIKSEETSRKRLVRFCPRRWGGGKALDGGGGGDPLLLPSPSAGGLI